FDFLPLDLGTISGFQTRFQLYTVPGQVYYDATRKLVLQGADGVVFVADSQRAQAEENVESFRNLQVTLLEQGVDPPQIPIVLQSTNLASPTAMSAAELDALLTYRCLPRYAARARAGAGVFVTLRGISDQVLRRLSQRFGRNVTAAR